ncbi:MAG: DUF308 domain-containing protein [Bacteroidia bacterium]
MKDFKMSAFWASLIHGILFILLGLLCVFMQQESLYGPVYYMGFLFLLSGLLYATISYLLRKSIQNWYFAWIWALLDITIGVFVFFKTDLATNYFIQLIGGFAILMSSSTIIASFFLKQYKIIFIINGIVSLAFGLMIVLNPLPAKFMGFMVGMYTLLLGLFMVYIGFLIKNLGNKENEIES